MICIMYILFYIIALMLHAKYYKENYGHDEKKTGPAENSKEIDEIIVKHLRRKKTEKIYRSWIEKIQKRYTIEINQKKWEKILSP